MAPETLLNLPDSGAPHSFAVDWWGVGILTFECLTGEAPFGERDMHDTLYERIGSCDYSWPGPKRFHPSLWPPHVGQLQQAKEFVAALLRADPRSRLGSVPSQGAVAGNSAARVRTTNGVSLDGQAGAALPGASRLPRPVAAPASVQPWEAVNGALHGVSSDAEMLKGHALFASKEAPADGFFTALLAKRIEAPFDPLHHRPPLQRASLGGTTNPLERSMHPNQGGGKWRPSAAECADYEQFSKALAMPWKPEPGEDVTFEYTLDASVPPLPPPLPPPPPPTPPPPPPPLQPPTPPPPTPTPPTPTPPTPTPPTPPTPQSLPPQSPQSLPPQSPQSLPPQSPQSLPPQSPQSPQSRPPQLPQSLPPQSPQSPPLRSPPPPPPPPPSQPPRPPPLLPPLQLPKDLGNESLEDSSLAC